MAGGRRAAPAPDYALSSGLNGVRRGSTANACRHRSRDRRDVTAAQAEFVDLPFGSGANAMGARRFRMATIEFSGYTGQAREGGSGPGLNRWDTRNVLVDAHAHAHAALHRRASRPDARWTSSEVTITPTLGFATCQFQVQHPVAPTASPHQLLGVQGPTAGKGPVSGHRYPVVQLRFPDTERSHLYESPPPTGKYRTPNATKYLSRRQPVQAAGAPDDYRWPCRCRPPRLARSLRFDQRPDRRQAP